MRSCYAGNDWIKEASVLAATRKVAGFLRPEERIKEDQIRKLQLRRNTGMPDGAGGALLTGY